MVAGHTHFSPDRVFSTATIILSSKDLYEIEDVMTALQGSSFTFKLFSDFKDWKNFLSRYVTKNGIKSMTEVAEICCDSEDLYVVYTNETLITPSIVPDLKNSFKQKYWKKSEFPNVQNIENLPSTPLSKEKIKDLQTMWDNGIIVEKAKKTYCRSDQ